jgi:hypothetical protein
MNEIHSQPQALDGDWPLRPWVLAGLMAIAGLLIFLATDGPSESPGRAALTAFAIFGSIAAAFTLDRGRWLGPGVFALVVGLVMAGLAWRTVEVGDRVVDEGFGFAAGLLASVLALPLYQAGFHRKRFAASYADTHFYVWSDAVSGAGALVFTGIAWLLLFLLAALFQLLKIEFLKDLINARGLAG